MDKPQWMGDVPSSSNYSSAVSSKKFDVFLSFRGEDTRFNFTSHLYNALARKNIETFIDNQLHKGDEISPALVKAIEDSQICIVIFSENYATSKWCLNELSKIIMELKKEKGHIVIPVFYKVEPSDVRYQIGRNKEAFAKHEGHYMYTNWKSALTDAANLCGWDSKNRSEAELLEDIVQDVFVLQKLTHTNPIPLKQFVGIERSYEEIESLLKIGSNKVLTLGIWGMGGIGKTTLATALYHKLSYQFEGQCFLANVREKSGNLEALCKEVASQLLGSKNHGFGNCDMSRLPRRKVFIVLDDVSEPEQLEKLIGEYDFMGAGSRVIVTTRDKQILSTLDEKFAVGELDPRYSLQLFCLTVFREKQPKEGYEHLSQEVISYCKGVPLALKVLGASLRGRSKEAWESELRKLEKFPNMKIHNVLKLSYDSLDRSQKDIFLDIVCFFTGEGRDSLIRLLEAFNFFPAAGIKVLLDKALITISNTKRIEMHDLIQEMGRKIVHQESEKYPGKRSRLWKHEDVLDVLKYNKGTVHVEGIIFNLIELKGDLSLRSNFLVNMNNLRFFRINEDLREFNVYFDDGLESLSNKLRCLHWYKCSLVSWPPNFCPEQLVQLHMPQSKFEKLWDGIQNFINLKSIDLSNSYKLVEIPDLSKAEKLEKIDLCDCRSLRQLHPSTLSLPKLTYLNLCGCKKIESLESNFHSKSLKELVLTDCRSLMKFSVISDEMKELDLSSIAICTLSPSIGDLVSLEVLDLSGCEKLVSLPKLPPSLIELDLSGCLKLVSLPELPLSLKVLYLNDCRKLMSLGKLLSSLIELDLSQCWELESLPELPQFLTRLHLVNCTKLEFLPLLPPLVEEVSAYNCTSLKTDMTQGIVLQHMSKSRIPYLHQQYLIHPQLCYSQRDKFIFPGDQIKEYGFHTTGGLIDIPCLPKSDLVGFIYCINVKKQHYVRDTVFIRILEDGKVVCTRYMAMESKDVLFSDHVFFSYIDIWELDRISEVDDQFGNMTFIFDVLYKQERIKGCGVFPVYATTWGLKLFNNGNYVVNSSSQQLQLLERESNTQISANESQAKRLRTSQ